MTKQMTNRVCDLINHGLSNREIVAELVRPADGSSPVSRGNYEVISDGLVSSLRDLLTGRKVTDLFTTGIFPPSAEHTLYSANHVHGEGNSAYLFWSDHEPGEAEVLLACGMDFEPDRGEYIDISAMDLSDIPVLPPERWAGQLIEPWTKEQLRSQMDEAGYITARVGIDVDELINGNIESFNDRVSMLITGTDLLEDIGYKVVGHEPGELVFEVTGKVDHIVWEKERCRD